jgi:hypothetical protein
MLNMGAATWQVAEAIRKDTATSHLPIGAFGMDPVVLKTCACCGKPVANCRKFWIWLYDHKYLREAECYSMDMTEPLHRR